MKKEELLSKLEAIKRQHGEWAYDIPLKDDVWTRGNLKIPHTRLKRIVQLCSDLVGKPLNECRVLDLGALDGQFSIEFAQQGAQTIGIEIREANIVKALFCKEVLGLDNLEFHQDDARNISVEKYGMFDIIICSGLLYHFTAGDAIEIMSNMHKMSNKLVVLDTHIALEPKNAYNYSGLEVFGVPYYEHDQNDSQELKAGRPLASWDNHESFWFTRPSLVNILSTIGFSSVYECFTPRHVNFGRPGLEHKDRCTFVAVKGQKVNMITSPMATNFIENAPEGSLDYAIIPVIQPSLVKRIKNRLKRTF